MATTSPDNLRTPDPGDPYNLVPDLATLSGDVQVALNKRGNTYKGTVSERNSFSSSASLGMLWQDTDGIGMLWKRGSSEWVPAVWSWSGTTAQRNSFTQAPNGFVWYDTSVNSEFIRISGAWRPKTQSGSFTLGAIGANTLGPSVDVTFPDSFGIAPRIITLNSTGFRIKPSYNFVTPTGMRIYPANVWGTGSPAGETLEWTATL